MAALLVRSVAPVKDSSFAVTLSIAFRPPGGAHKISLPYH